MNSFPCRYARHDGQPGLVPSPLDNYLADQERPGRPLPPTDNTHEVAQRLHPGARVVYVDNGPVVLAHARALLVGIPEGARHYLEADLRDVDRILTAAQETLDLSQPVALMLVAIPAVRPRRRRPLRRRGHRRRGGRRVEARAYNEGAAEHAGATLRTHAEVSRFFAGTDLLAPGVVELPEWRPGPGDGPAPGVPLWCGVGRKT
ncbi:MAG: hypothetical protein HOY79_47810 [Streptomyces sp.]|nr:hypothetical protein [Streptomyces sp.]